MVGTLAQTAGQQRLDLRVPRRLSNPVQTPHSRNRNRRWSGRHPGSGGERLRDGAMGAVVIGAMAGETGYTSGRVSRAMSTHQPASSPRPLRG